MSNSTERDPLINPTASAAVRDGPKKAAGQLGPLEITQSTRWGILAGIWTANFLSALNTTLVATLLPSISSEFNKSNQASWLGTSYLLAICTFTPLYGRLCNVMGRRGANQTAVFLAGLGTLCCGLSTNMYMLIAARFLGGLGGGGVNTTASIVTSDMYSLRDRGLAQGVSSVFNGLGMGLGGPLGGLISDWLGWRWAFLLQLPIFLVSLALTQWNLTYVTPGKGKSTREVLKRIDWGGTFTLFVAVGSFLVFLSTRYNEDLPWGDVTVIVPLVLACVFAVAFVVVELFIAPEPVMAPFLLRQKVPVLVGMSNFLVSLNNFAIMYFFPMWFQTVALTSAATAGMHLMPNSFSMSCGSLFAGWMMHKFGKYKTINLTFGILPFLAGVLISRMREDSPAAQQWLSIIPLGFGNAVVFQTMLIALISHLPESQMAVGTGFGQVFRGIGQVSGVGIASALFQSILGSELNKRIHGPDAAELIKNIRHSARLVASLPPDIQKNAREAYATSLKAVFTLAACASFLAFVVRLPIPEMKLDSDSSSRPRKRSASIVRPRPLDGPVDSGNANPATAAAVMPDDDLERSGSPEHDLDQEVSEEGDHVGAVRVPARRRLSTYESVEGSMDLEDERFGGSARQGSVLASRSR
ncbi:MFS general substrate transporter [Athelia psychrophila]|uniref:MFS general substrate transporter n=1 Tax=Athelia psychrophila TaxID=1759441 RepID=A0A166BP98_9AGAM|nr:MFS general substrate transporter [Fibularhizoctonia sp. CBS 109695]KZP12841.1 MFS general substrate transporter [Fibularhizoctonia sp. CBS 109695]